MRITKRSGFIKKYIKFPKNNAKNSIITNQKDRLSKFSHNTPIYGRLTNIER